MTDPRTRIFGQKIHQDTDYGFAFWRPLNWNQFDMAGQHGIIYCPEQDPRTGFYVLARELGQALGEAITEADLPALYEGIVEALQDLPDCQVLAQQEIAKESAIGFEFLITFALDGEICKRRMRMLYKDRQQITVYGQGISEKEYDVFANVFDWMYMTFTFSDLGEQLDKMYPDPYSPPQA